MILEDSVKTEKSLLKIRFIENIFYKTSFMCKFMTKLRLRNVNENFNGYCQLKVFFQS